jgi:hypothetical protein
MRLTQLTEAPDTQELEQAVQALVSRYAELFPTDTLTEDQTTSLHDVVTDLKLTLLKSEDTTYQGIDFLMREVSHAHDVNVHDVHDAFVDAEGVTPDEWIQSHKSAT